MKSNLPLFLHYTRFGHFVKIRQLAIDSVLVLDGFKNEAIIAYLSNLIVYDTEPLVRYSAARSVFNFGQIVLQQIRGGYYQLTQKKAYLERLNGMCEILSTAVPYAKLNLELKLVSVHIDTFKRL
jgi:hypothetical protein